MKKKFRELLEELVVNNISSGNLAIYDAPISKKIVRRKYINIQKKNSKKKKI